MEGGLTEPRLENPPHDGGGHIASSDHTDSGMESAREKNKGASRAPSNGSTRDGDERASGIESCQPSSSTVSPPSSSENSWHQTWSTSEGSNRSAVEEINSPAAAAAAAASSSFSTDIGNVATSMLQRVSSTASTSTVRYPPRLRSFGAPVTTSFICPARGSRGGVRANSAGRTGLVMIEGDSGGVGGSSAYADVTSKEGGGPGQSRANSSSSSNVRSVPAARLSSSSSSYNPPEWGPSSSSSSYNPPEWGSTASSSSYNPPEWQPSSGDDSATGSLADGDVGGVAAEVGSVTHVSKPSGGLALSLSSAASLKSVAPSSGNAADWYPSDVHDCRTTVRQQLLPRNALSASSPSLSPAVMSSKTETSTCAQRQSGRRPVSKLDVVYETARRTSTSSHDQDLTLGNIDRDAPSASAPATPVRRSRLPHHSTSASPGCTAEKLLLKGDGDDNSDASNLDEELRSLVRGKAAEFREIALAAIRPTSRARATTHEGDRVPTCGLGFTSPSPTRSPASPHGGINTCTEALLGHIPRTNLGVWVTPPDHAGLRVVSIGAAAAGDGWSAWPPGEPHLIAMRRCRSCPILIMSPSPIHLHNNHQPHAVVHRPSAAPTDSTGDGEASNTVGTSCFDVVRSRPIPSSPEADVCDSNAVMDDLDADARSLPMMVAGVLSTSSVRSAEAHLTAAVGDSNERDLGTFFAVGSCVPPSPGSMTRDVLLRSGGDVLLRRQLAAFDGSNGSSGYSQNRIRKLHPAPASTPSASDGFSRSPRSSEPELLSTSVFYAIKVDTLPSGRLRQPGQDIDLAISCASCTSREIDTVSRLPWSLFNDGHSQVYKNGACMTKTTCGGSTGIMNHESMLSTPPVQETNAIGKSAVPTVVPRSRGVIPLPLNLETRLIATGDDDRVFPANVSRSTFASRMPLGVAWPSDFGLNASSTASSRHTTSSGRLLLPSYSASVGATSTGDGIMVTPAASVAGTNIGSLSNGREISQSEFPSASDTSSRRLLPPSLSSSVVTVGTDDDVMVTPAGRSVSFIGTDIENSTNGWSLSPSASSPTSSTMHSVIPVASPTGSGHGHDERASIRSTMSRINLEDKGVHPTPPQLLSPVVAATADDTAVFVFSTAGAQRTVSSISDDVPSPVTTSTNQRGDEGAAEENLNRILSSPSLPRDMIRTADSDPPAHEPSQIASDESVEFSPLAGSTRRNRIRRNEGARSNGAIGEALAPSSAVFRNDGITVSPLRDRKSRSSRRRQHLRALRFGDSPSVSPRGRESSWSLSRFAAAKHHDSASSASDSSWSLTRAIASGKIATTTREHRQEEGSSASHELSYRMTLENGSLPSVFNNRDLPVEPTPVRVRSTSAARTEGTDDRTNTSLLSRPFSLSSVGDGETMRGTSSVGAGDGSLALNSNQVARTDDGSDDLPLTPVPTQRARHQDTLAGQLRGIALVGFTASFMGYTRRLRAARDPDEESYASLESDSEESTHSFSGRLPNDEVNSASLSGGIGSIEYLQDRVSPSTSTHSIIRAHVGTEDGESVMPGTPNSKGHEPGVVYDLMGCVTSLDWASSSRTPSSVTLPEMNEVQHPPFDPSSPAGVAALVLESRSVSSVTSPGISSGVRRSLKSTNSSIPHSSGSEEFGTLPQHDVEHKNALLIMPAYSASSPRVQVGARCPGESTGSITDVRRKSSRGGGRRISCDVADIESKLSAHSKGDSHGVSSSLAMARSASPYHSEGVSQKYSVRSQSSRVLSPTSGCAPRRQKRPDRKSAEALPISYTAAMGAESRRGDPIALNTTKSSRCRTPEAKRGIITAAATAAAADNVAATGFVSASRTNNRGQGIEHPLLFSTPSIGEVLLAIDGDDARNTKTRTVRKGKALSDGYIDAFTNDTSSRNLPAARMGPRALTRTSASSAPNGIRGGNVRIRDDGRQGVTHLFSSPSPDGSGEFRGTHPGKELKDGDDISNYSTAVSVTMSRLMSPEIREDVRLRSRRQESDGPCHGYRRNKVTPEVPDFSSDLRHKQLENTPL